MHHIFLSPFTCSINGPSNCGKSSFVATVIANSDAMFERKAKFFWFYGVHQKLFSDLAAKFSDKVEFHEGLPTPEMIDRIADQSDACEPIMIIDDLFESSMNSQTVVDIFTKDSHHRGISIFLLSQNAFAQGKYSRTISLNTKYIVWFNSPRDRSQIRHMNSQMFPDNPKFLTSAFRDATSNGGYSYLFLDLHQTTPENLRVKTKIFPTDDMNIVYLPK